jgi:hypothetical protein
MHGQLEKGPRSRLRECIHELKDQGLVFGASFRHWLRSLCTNDAIWKDGMLSIVRFNKRRLLREYNIKYNRYNRM